MPRGGKTITIFLSHEDRLVTVMHKTKRVVTDFTAQLDTLIEDEWLEVTRVDTCHGSAHQHKFNPSGKEIRTEFFCNDYNQGFTEAKRYITENFEQMRQNYLTQLAKRRNN